MFLFLKKHYFSLAAVLIIIVVFVWLVCLPLLGRVKKLSQSYLDNKMVLAQLEQKEKSFKDLNRSYREEKDNLEFVENIFVKNEEVVDFIKTLEDLAKKTVDRYEIKTASDFESSNKGDSYLALRLSLTGNFSGILLFLANLENIPYPPYRLIEIEDFSIKQAGGEDNKLEASVGIKVYTQQ